MLYVAFIDVVKVTIKIGKTIRSTKEWKTTDVPGYVSMSCVYTHTQLSTYPRTMTKSRTFVGGRRGYVG